MGKKRIVIPGAVHHSYQRTKPGKLIFYSARDALVFYTIAMTFGERFGIRHVGLCLMPDHIHQLTIPPDVASFSEYHALVTSVFVREFNADCGRSGALFDEAEPFGSAPKTKSKAVRTSIAYLANNAPERFLCGRAEQYRWNFIAYGNDKHPFSNPIRLRKASFKLRKCLEEIDACHSQGRYLRYEHINRLFAGLSSDEREQLIDYIIVKYNRIDYGYMLSFYRSYDDMLTAVNSNTGAEYDILEERSHGSDAIYRDMCRIALKSGMVTRPKDVIMLPLQDKKRLARKISSATGADLWHITRFLHLEAQ